MEPVLVVGQSKTRGTANITDWTICVVCQIPGKSKLSTLGVNGRSRLANCVAERLEVGDEHCSETTNRLKDKDLLNIPETILCHRNCYSGYCNSEHIKRLKDKQATSDRASVQSKATSTQGSTKSHQEVSTLVTRSHVSPLDIKLCIFCQSKKVATTHQVMTFDVSHRILTSSKRDFVMSIRLANEEDLVAAEALYHVQCLTEFNRKTERVGLEHKTSARDICLTKLADEVRVGVSQGHVYNLLDVWHRFDQMMLALGEEAGNYRNSKTRFKQRLEKELCGIIDFVPQLDSRSPQLLFPKEAANVAIPALKRKHDELVETLTIQDLSQNQPKADDENDILISMHHIAMLIRRDLNSLYIHKIILDYNTFMYKI